ncbi:MAG: TonB-dependent receptor [Myxococcales bacterium]|nr:TonB-dependent receptor [Myxococcales bacterium]
MIWPLWVAAAGADCPAPLWPPGVDPEPARVRLVVRTDGDGVPFEVLEQEGPSALVRSAIAGLERCTLAPDTDVPLTWAVALPPVNVSGVLRARGTGDPLVGRVVLVGERVARTDDRGRFELRNVAEGDHALRLGDPEWRLPPTTVHVEPEAGLELELWAGPGRPQDELVAIYDRDEGAVVARTVDLERASAMPGSLDDPLRALAGQPGLTRAPFDSGWLLVRGADYDEVGLFVQGVRVPLVYHLGGFTSILHPELVDRVDFWPGLFPARYGQALSGAVDLSLRPVGDRAYASVGANVVFASVWAEVPTPFGGIAVGARRSWLDGVLALAVGPDAAGIAPRFWDAELHATIGEGSLTVFGLSDAIDAPSFDGDGVLVIEQQAIQAQAVVPVGDVRIQPYFASTHRTVTGEVGSDVEPQSVGELYPGLRIVGETTLDPLTVGAGFDGQRHDFALTRSTADAHAAVWTLDPFASISVDGPVRLWSEVRGTLDIVEGDPYQPVRTGLSPRAGATFTPRPWLDLHTSFGRLVATPTPTLWLGIADGAYLDLERSEQVTAGVRLGDERLQLDVDGWTRQARDLAELELDGSVGQLSARAEGVESMLRGRHRDFVASALFQLTRSDKREDPDDSWAPSAFEVPVRVELTALQSLPRAWEVSARFRATSGFPRTSLLDLPNQPPLFTPTSAYDILLQRTVDLELPDDQARLAPYHALDLHVGKVFAFRRWELATALDLQNVYNRRVVEPVITGFGESRPSYGFGLPVLPVFSVEARTWP